MKIVSVAEMRELEAAAFASGVSEAELQRRAGEAVAEEVAQLIEPGGRVVVFVGHGNNGRDGAVAAKWLAQKGRKIELVLAPRHAVTEEELHQLHAVGATVTEAAGDTLETADAAIDGLAGIGIKGALREPLAGLAKLLNEHRPKQIVAIDVPSGVDADTGEVPGEAVRADVTVTLGAVKQGLLLFPAAEYVGRLRPRPIGLEDSKLPYEVLEAQARLRRRPLDAHKYKFGRVLVLAGSDHFLGAPVLCAGGALRAGAGLVTVGSTADVRRTVAAHLPEATYTIQDLHNDVHAVEGYLESHQAVVIGPGLGRGADVTRFVEEVLSKRPQGGIVIDADALVALAELDEWPKRLPPNTVLTPHTGELARLMASELPNEPPWQLAARLAQEWQCVLLAKGPFTSVAEPSGQVHVWPHANPALATGGTGDVLAGICGGLLAQGHNAGEAARLAVQVHALAAERITQRGQSTLLASDLLKEIPAVITRPR